MIDIYSPSGKEEELLEFLLDYLKQRGIPVTLQTVDENRYNILAMPAEMEPRLAMIGHVDTVVAYDFDHYGFTEEGDRIIGLGAADMKGGCAAMIEAFLTFWEKGYSLAPVALALVVGEEEEGDGAMKLVKDFHFPRALIGEPTNLQPCLSHYGYMEVQVNTEGKRMHASLANPGQNPIENMLKLLLKLSHYMAAERPEIVYNIRELSNSQAGFAVPEACEAWIDLHLPPSAPLGEITLEIEEILMRERQENPDFNGTLRFTTIHAGYELPEKGPLVQSLKEIYARHSLPWKPEAFRSHSDANLLWAAGVKPILMGPGQLEKAHARDEDVSFEQVLTACEIYYDLLVSISS
jgi:acetylornithine deacetylase